MRRILATCGLVLCLHGTLWWSLRPEASAPAAPGRLQSVSYTPFDGSMGPDSSEPTRAAQIRTDLAALRGKVNAIRTYAATGGSEQIPRIAAEFGLATSLGAWLGRDDQRNQRELAQVIQLARSEPGVRSIVVGNETLYRSEQTVSQLIRKIRQVRRETRQPVTTGEVWSLWLEHPELVREVDFISAHILPYWEGVPATRAVDETLRAYHRLQRAYPGKRIVIAEFGWPSAGHNRRDAVPGPMLQARVLREFTARAAREGIEYNIIEAYDQPWKTFEGSVGPYWGLWNTAREAKFAWQGPVVFPDYTRYAVIALLVGTAFMWPLLRLQGARTGQLALRAVTAQAVGACTAGLMAFWSAHYFSLGTTLAYGFGGLLLLPLVWVALYRIEEVAALALGPAPSRLPVLSLTPETSLPRVSIHIPACREQPEMLMKTLDAVARLDYPDFECVVVVNNTPNRAMWQPVAEHCAALGPRFRFVRADDLQGYKAGALRLALAHTATDASVIGVLDADYVVRPEWLRDLVPLFTDPAVAIVQAPQDHRDGTRSVLHQAMNQEYAGFFDIGMVHRNEANGVVVHGTLCLIRRAALEQAGGWASDTICEDTDLGLAVLEQGATAHYTSQRYGYGLLPDNYLAFKRQRHRWAYGGMQILRKHWRRFMPGRSALTGAQKRVFLLGWLSWLGAETVGVLMAMLNLLLVPFVALAGVLVPETVMTLPVIASFAITMGHFLVLYRTRVRASWLEMLGALVAAMSLQWTIARATAAGLLGDSLPFIVTAKGGTRRRSPFPAFHETILGGALLGGGALVQATNHEAVTETSLFAAVLVLQALPFLAATGIAIVESTRLNEFAFWARLRGTARVTPTITRELPAGDALDSVFAEKRGAADSR